MKEAIIIFIKNPELGKAKTRLAATIGNEKALEIYKYLLHHTRNIALEVPVDRHLFYNQFIDKQDQWPNHKFQKHLQVADQDLGLKMYSAFMQLFKEQYEKVLIIGSDCLELNADIVKSAFDALKQKTAVIGPALDGGYYSIGFNFKAIGSAAENLLKAVFLHKTWSHENVCNEAKSALEQHSASFFLLPALSDVDVEEDIKHLLDKPIPS